MLNGYFSSSRRPPDSFLGSGHQTVNPLRLGIEPADSTIREKALVVIEQLDASHVNVPDFVAAYQAGTAANPEGMERV
jgi:hypothetical protein